ncbi:F-box protein At5g52880 isoform X2 [Spinacia oleracea]|uniref:F-box protein At5g52880 isoform X2 n=1 Tax=Spinacia oleracea TaxID=3562 RepID=A0A9R0JMM0_SPIOL|nr:F-box protein At5g52880 isoform X2 [Spinacia oleracea]
MAGAIKKYKNLKLRESLSVSYRYPIVCNELGVILRLGYSKSPKPLQSLILEDTIAAFRLLPQMQTQGAVSAANLLSQSAEAALPKQKRGLAATEFKQAKVAYKRRSKTQVEDKDVGQLPQDVLVHLFNFLEMPTLVTVGMVCRSWNEAAVDNYLWKFHYNTHFSDSESILKMEDRQDGVTAKDRQHTASNGESEDVNYDWKDAFRRLYLAIPSRRYKYNRGYCGQCRSIVWLSNLKCPNKHSSRRGSGGQLLKPLSPSQIVRYILDDTYWLIYSSDTDDDDSESDEVPCTRFWML